MDGSSRAHEYAATLAARRRARRTRKSRQSPGDRFFMLSDSWNAFEELAPLFARIRQQGGEIVSCVFDLIPELYPHACHDVTVPLYDAWLRKALVESDGFLAISRTVALELAASSPIVACRIRSGLKIGWFHCGSDMAAGGGPELATHENPGRRRRRSPGFPLRLDDRAAQGPARRATGLRRAVARGRRRQVAVCRPARLARRGRWSRNSSIIPNLAVAVLVRRRGDGELAFLYERARALLSPLFRRGVRSCRLSRAAWRGRAGPV